MSRAKIYLRNLTANWIGYGLNLVIMFAMSPFVIHRLGDVDYGVWTIMMTMTGYLGLVEIGTRGGLGRFINFYIGKNDIAKLNGTINTAMVIFAAIGGLLVVVSSVLVVFLPTIFPKIPENLIPDTRIILCLIAFNVWVSFFNAAFRQILAAYERFDLRNIADLIVLLLRTGATIAALLSGYRLVSLAVIQTVTSLLGLLIAYLMARRVFPRLALHFTLASRERFNELFGFSIWAFIGDLSYRLLYSADNIVIGIMLGPKWVTYYSVGGLLLFRSREFISQAASIFGPKIMQDCATGDLKSIRLTFKKGSNLTMGACILLFVGMLAFGKEFIVLWMGPQFEISFQILMILTVSSFFAVAFQVAGPVYAGMHRVKLSAMLVLTQGLANLGLTIFFVSVLNLGIEGVAWGSFYPRIIWSVITAVIVFKMIRLKFTNFIMNEMMRWALLVLVFGAICLGINQMQWSSGWQYFIIKTVIATIFYIPLAYFILLDSDERTKVLRFVLEKIKIEKANTHKL